jgi:hypothetical protein
MDESVQFRFFASSFGSGNLSAIHVLFPAPTFLILFRENLVDDEKVDEYILKLAENDVIEWMGNQVINEN